MIFSVYPKIAQTPGNLQKKVIWEKTVHNFGDIKQGTPVKVSFNFTNNLDYPLILKKVKASCGCTATDYPKEPILPGKKASIIATYNAANKGAFNKSITITTNAEENIKVLYIKGTVK